MSQPQLVDRVSFYGNKEILTLALFQDGEALWLHIERNRNNQVLFFLLGPREMKWLIEKMNRKGVGI